MWDQMNVQGSWNLRFVRAFNDLELDMVVNFLNALQKEKVNSELDKISWKGGKDDLFSVRDANKLLQPIIFSVFPFKCIWVPCALTKTTFFAWEVAWGKVLALDKSQRRRW